MPDLLTRDGRLRSLKLRGEEVRRSIGRQIAGAPTLELSTTAIAQLSFAVYDPGFELLDSGLFAPRTAVTYLELAFEVSAVETGGGSGTETVALSCLSRLSQKMRRAKGADIAKDLSPTAYMERRVKAHGGAFIGQPSAKRAQVGRVDPKGERSENDVTVGQRLARELGFIFFEAAGTVYFGKPTWLVERSRDFTVRYPRAHTKSDVVPDQVPRARRSADGEEGRETTVELDLPFEEGQRLRPGRVLELRGVPSFRADYMVDTVSIILDEDSSIGVSAVTPKNPQPEPPEKGADLDGDGIVDTSGEAVPDNPGPGGGTSGGGWRWPAEGPVTSPFGPRGGRMHEGIDIGAGYGARVVAAKGGTVAFTAYDSDGYGHWVEIDHGGGYRTRYAHFASAPPVRAGQRLEGGQLVAHVDTSGNATGPHLHFEVRRAGVPIDPLGVLP